MSLFIDADARQIDASRKAGAAAIEIHTGQYAEATRDEVMRKELQKVQRAVEHGRAAGLIVNAGHGLHYHNTQAIAAIEGIHELNIGHAIIARAVLTGLDEAVRSMRALIDQACSR